jgi:deoxyribodipyrimidine photolyase-related protein
VTEGVLRLVLGDQLSDSLSALADLDPAVDVVLMAEVRAEATYVKHHKQKLALIFGGMRNFAERLRGRGVVVRYVRIDDPENSGSIDGELLRALDDQPFARVVVTHCGEWRLQQRLESVRERTSVPLDVREDDRFVCSREEFEGWARGRADLVMEFFYRKMRAQTGLLMNGHKPAGDRWNFDKDNRSRLPHGIAPPRRQRVPPNPLTRGAIADVARLFPDNFGDLEEFGFPTTTEEAHVVLEHFITDVLDTFGDYQDAMATEQPFLWHGLISTALNQGLLLPLEVCRRIAEEYEAGRAPLNACEGFIRQILGWREFVRGIYWLKMPEYGLRNALDADRHLPWFYWSGETRSACINDVVETTRRHAYAHHIQRLMVTGQFAMLLGVHPDGIDEWYLAVYADAYEWVEMPNTRGMATYADGGIMGTKPYAGSGAYINKMSDYCGRCSYDVKQRTGPDACPFNVLYWDFFMRHEGRLRSNRRVGYAYTTLSRWSEEHRREIREEAERRRRAYGATDVELTPFRPAPGEGPDRPTIGPGPTPSRSEADEVVR